MKKDTKYSTLDLIRSVWRFARIYKWKFFVATLLRITCEVVWLYPAYALASVVTFFAHYHQGDSVLPFWHIMELFLAVVVIYFVTIYYSNLIGYRFADRCGVDAEFQAVQHLFSLDVDWHEKENTGNKVKKIDRGSDAVFALIRMWFASWIGIVVDLVGVVFILSRFDKTITLATLVFLVLYFSVSLYFTKRGVQAQRATNVKEEELSGLIFESVNNIRSAKVMSMVRPLSDMIRNLSGELSVFQYERLFWFQTGGALKNMVGALFRVIVTAYIGFGIIQGWYQIGFMILFYSYFSTIQGAVATLADTTQDFATRKQAVERMADLLKEESVTDVEEGKLPFPSDWKKIEVRNLSFAYGEKKVLDDVTFTITRGEKIGVVGLSGAGKSTLFKLLLKERENYDGEILVDGVHLRDISKQDYFTHTAVVLQETEVFNFSLRDNVTISNYKKANDESLLDKALNVAHVTEFARALPKGIETLIGEKGVKLSGGEKQRVGVARAVFKDPELLLLDEATSHLDIESEEKIQDSLHQFFQTVTAIVIAHRLTTIKEMNKILVIEGGKILEQGSFAELQAKKGRFYGLWEKQKL